MHTPRILTQEHVLSIVLVPDEGKFGAYCPELDLVAEMETREEAIEDMLEAMREYAKEYMEDVDLYAQSPNRAHHVPYIQAITACKTDRDLRMLIEIRHSVVYV